MGACDLNLNRTLYGVGGHDLDLNSYVVDGPDLDLNQTLMMSWMKMN